MGVGRHEEGGAELMGLPGPTLDSRAGETPLDFNCNGTFCETVCKEVSLF